MPWKIGEFDKGNMTFDRLPSATIDYDGPATNHQAAIEIRGENCLEIAASLLPKLNEGFADTGTAI